MAFPDDFAERSRAIFERLRTQQDSDASDDGHPADGEEAPAEERAAHEPWVAEPRDDGSLAPGDQSEPAMDDLREASWPTTDEREAELRGPGGEEVPVRDIAEARDRIDLSHDEIAGSHDERSADLPDDPDSLPVEAQGIAWSAADEPDADVSGPADVAGRGEGLGAAPLAGPVPELPTETAGVSHTTTEDGPTSSRDDQQAQAATATMYSLPAGQTATPAPVPVELPATAPQTVDEGTPALEAVELRANPPQTVDEGSPALEAVELRANPPQTVDEGSPAVDPARELPDPQRFARPLPRVLAIANQKGGVGKTTTTVNLGASLAVLGFRVLVVDLDPQGNATTGLGVNSRNLDASIYDVILHDVPLDDCIEPTSLRNLFVAPATIDLAGAEIELVPAFSREQRLKRALADVKDDYDFVLVDCPPSLGLLTVNALSAASEVLVPIQCEYYALEGLGQLLRNINLVQSNLNPDLELSAIVLTMYDARTKLAEQVADEVREHFGDRVCRNVVPRTVRLSEAPSFGQPIIVFDPSSRGALAYRELAREVSGGPPQRSR